MSNGLLQILRYFLLAMLWLFFIYAARMVIVDIRRGRGEPAQVGDDQIGAPSRAPAKLRIIEPRARRGQSFDLTHDVTLGRSTTCVVALEDDFASSVHARVFVRDGSAYVEDLGSTNGTYVNEERIASPTALGRGDLLRIGGTVLEVRR